MLINEIYQHRQFIAEPWHSECVVAIAQSLLIDDDRDRSELTRIIKAMQ
jgi:hypothetical protein